VADLRKQQIFAVIFLPAHIILSGGSSGIGLALAKKLARSGYNISILARDGEKLKAARADIQAVAERPVGVHTEMVDVTDEGAVATAVDCAIAEFGPPALVVTSAGIVVPGTFLDLPSAAYSRTMDVNYMGTVNVIRAALPSMRRCGSGRFVILSSGAGLIGLYGYTSYSPSKFALRGLAEALRAELKPEGIDVSIVYPPDTDTPQLREELKTRPKITSTIAGSTRVYSADEVADAIIRGVQRARFTIAPGWEMTVLSRLHSLISPFLNRYSFDPIIARAHKKK
jgi:3-dehydrosphinganine reductase